MPVSLTKRNSLPRYETTSPRTPMSPRQARRSHSLGHARSFFLVQAFGGNTRSSSSKDVTNKDAGVNTKDAGVKPPPFRTSHSHGHTRSFFLGRALSALSVTAASALSAISGSKTSKEQGSVSARVPVSASNMGTTRGEARPN